MLKAQTRMEVKMMKKLKGFSEKSFSDKTNQLFGQKKKKNNDRFLITINVLGSCGPIRFVVNEDEKAASVIDATLKVYGHQGRLPVLGSNTDAFSLFPAFAEYDDGNNALKSTEAIGYRGARNFVLCKVEMRERRSDDITIKNKKGGGWRAWLHKSLSLNIPSH